MGLGDEKISKFKFSTSNTYLIKLKVVSNERTSKVTYINTFRIKKSATPSTRKNVVNLTTFNFNTGQIDQIYLINVVNLTIFFSHI